MPRNDVTRETTDAHYHVDYGGCVYRNHTSNEHVDRDLYWRLLGNMARRRSRKITVARTSALGPSGRSGFFPLMRATSQSPKCECDAYPSPPEAPLDPDRYIGPAIREATQQDRLRNADQIMEKRQRG